MPAHKYADWKSLAQFEPLKGSHCLQVCLQTNLYITWAASKLIIRLPHTQISDTASCHSYETLPLPLAKIYPLSKSD